MNITSLLPRIRANDSHPTLRRLQNIADIYSGRQLTRKHNAEIRLTAIGYQPNETYQHKPGTNEWYKIIRSAK
jgi:hypothetical protein